MPTRTELIWDGKYDANGKRVAPSHVALPFQTVETVNESAQDRERNLQRSQGAAGMAVGNRGSKTLECGAQQGDDQLRA